MTWARLRLTPPDGSWIGDVSGRHPDATIQVVAAHPEEESAFVIVSIVADEADALVEAIETHPTVREVAVLQRTDGETTVQFEATRPPVLGAVERAGVPVELPMRIRDCEAVIDIASQPGRLAELSRSLEERDVDYELVFAGARPHAEHLLTDTQEELLLTAFELGYYETPRRCTLTELADVVGIANSTCCETLHRAEAKLVGQFVDELPHAKPPVGIS